MANVLITGATGFVGGPLTAKLQLLHNVVAPVRAYPTDTYNSVHYHLIEDISKLAQTSDLFKGIETVIHVAAMAHKVDVSLEQFRAINTDATLHLASAAAASGVKRFIFLSSIGVNGTQSKHPFSISDIPAPTEGYGISKLEAESGLKRIASETKMEFVIIRPPLVYGRNAPGNFGKLIELVKKNIPLPLGALNNRRSFISIDNLVDVIITCIERTEAANQTFLVSDDADISTTQFLKIMCYAAGNRPMLLKVPISWLKLVGTLTRKQKIIDRLCGDLQIDMSHTKKVLQWKPPLTLKEGIAKCFASNEKE